MASTLHSTLNDPLIPFTQPPNDDVTTDFSSSPTTEQQQRLVSLDVFRGLTVALMILVDDAGGPFPSINHSPWFGITLADFVMPFFLFGVGISVALVFKRIPNKVTATKKVVLRTINLFVLGLVLQGGYFHGRNKLTYGVDIGRIRWLGILQRISIGYFLAAMAEIWLVSSNMLVDSPKSYMKKYYVEWERLPTLHLLRCGPSLDPAVNAGFLRAPGCPFLSSIVCNFQMLSLSLRLPSHVGFFSRIVAVLLSSIYVCLLLAVYVPDWEFQVMSSNSTLTSPFNKTEIETVHCRVRGSLDPPCNTVGYIDRLILGQGHLYGNPVYKRTKECSINSPDYGPLPQNSPNWCRAPFDPEGLLSSLMAAVTCFIGLEFGHFIIHFKGHAQRMLLWSIASLSLLLCGFIVQLLGMPFSKPLYTVSYMFLTAGASGILFSIIYYIVDLHHFKRPFILFQWMGMNALIVYMLAACELFPEFVQGFYWHSPENNLVNLTESVIQATLHSKRWGTLAFVLLEILFWGLAAGFLHMKGMFIKL